MTANPESSTVEVHLQTPSGDVSVGQFSLNDGQVTGTDHRGITYRGTCTPMPDGGLNVELMASVPAGTRIGESKVTETDAEHKLAFHLNQEQVAGQQTKEILLSGFGSADVRFEVR
ncbi:MULTISPECIES: hypothetical protein [unclassified Streptomyces]|uniref:hypothetical protein n=1 Tax=unclassified Streptomyces TaxID=2593676 RepID=UPI002E12C9D2|nr:hypothetical protein OG395_50265 [Streptomyces sp. NBC_01320]